MILPITAIAISLIAFLVCSILGIKLIYEDNNLKLGICNITLGVINLVMAIINIYNFCHPN